MITDIINQLINQYTGSISNLQTGSIALGKELFNAIALISIALLGFNHLLRKNVDLVDANFELIKWLIYLDFFYAFITNFPSIYSSVFSSIQQIGNYLGAQAAGKVVDISPSNIFQIGITLALKILASNVTFNLFRNLLYPLTSVLSAAIILYCFATIGLELILIQIGSQIILVGGIFLLAFSGFQWTRDYAERYVHTFFHIGIKMIFMYILVGLGVGLAQGWSQVVVNEPMGKVVEYDIAVCLSTYIYYKLCLKVPDQAVSWLTGRLSMGFDSATDVKGAIKTVAALPAHSIAMAHGASGMANAVGAARQAAQATGGGTWASIKTLGAAMKAEGWDKKVVDTLGGKMSKNISDQAANDALDRQGDSKAQAAAVTAAKAKFDAQGIVPNQQDIKKQAASTFEMAKQNVEQSELDKVVDATEGGKIAKNILAAIPEAKPQEDYTI